MSPIVLSAATLPVMAYFAAGQVLDTGIGSRKTTAVRSARWVWMAVRACMFGE